MQFQSWLMSELYQFKSFYLGFRFLFILSFCISNIRRIWFFFSVNSPNVSFHDFHGTEGTIFSQQREVKTLIGQHLALSLHSWAVMATFLLSPLPQHTFSSKLSSEVSLTAHGFSCHSFEDSRAGSLGSFFLSMWYGKVLPYQLTLLISLLSLDFQSGLQQDFQ